MTISRMGMTTSIEAYIWLMVAHSHKVVKNIWKGGSGSSQKYYRMSSAFNGIDA